MKACRIYYVTLFLVFLTGCLNISQVNIPKAEKGVIDLRQWDFQKNEPIELDGEWEFYWKKFKSDITKNDKPHYIQVPSFWNNYELDNRKLGSDGYAFYRLQILLPENTPPLAIKYPGADGGSLLYIGDKIYQQGKPGRSPEETFPVRYYDIVHLQKNILVTLEMDVANYFHKSGGIKYPFLLGTEKRVHFLTNRDRLIEAMYLASYLILGIYHLVLFLLYKNRSILYFSIFSIMLSLRATFVGERIVHVIFSDIDFRYDVRIEYFTFFLSVSFFAYFLNSIFPKEFDKKTRNLISGFGFLYLFTLLLPSLILTQILIGFQLATLLFTAIFIAAAVKAVYRRRPASVIFMVAFIALAIGTTTDIFMSILYSRATAYSSVGLLLFVLAQGLNLSLNINKLNREKEESKRDALESKYLMNILKVRNDVIEKDLSLARDIQLKMIPEDMADFGITLLYLPCDKIGGDLIQIVELREKKLGIFISDVSGHGVPSALISIMLKTIMKNLEFNYWNKGERFLEDPDNFLIEMNQQIYGHTNGNFATAIYGIYDKKRLTFNYASAGHVYPIILSQEEGMPKLDFFMNEKRYSPLGIRSSEEFIKKQGKASEIHLKQNSALLLYTDGLLENSGYDFVNIEAGLESFKETDFYSVFASYNTLKGRDFINKIHEILNKKRNSEKDDDVCLLKIET